MRGKMTEQHPEHHSGPQPWQPPQSHYPQQPQHSGQPGQPHSSEQYGQRDQSGQQTPGAQYGPYNPYPRSGPYGQPNAQSYAQAYAQPPAQPNQPNHPNQYPQYPAPTYPGAPRQSANAYSQPQQPQPNPQNPRPQPSPGVRQTNPYTPRPANPAAPIGASAPAPASSPYYYARPARKRGLSGGGVAAIIITVILIPVLLFAAVTAGFVAVANKAVDDAARQSQQSQSQTTPQDTKPTVKYISMKERPAYQETLDYVNGKYTQYSNEALDDLQAFMDKYRIPVTDDGGKYVTDFIAVLGKYTSEIKLMGDTIGINAEEMDDLITSYRTDTDTVEGHFLKGEPLAVTVTLTGRDGETYTVDGQNSVELKPLWADLEAKIAAASNSMGSTYAESAQKIVELAGMQVNWDFNAGNQYCTKSSSTNPDMKALEDKETFAYYCPVTPNVIYANPNASGWDTDYAPAAAIRHELAHHAIHMYCGTSHPPIAVQDGIDRTEGVTNSYAIKYLGADRNWVEESARQAAQAQHAQYLMNEYTDKAAEAIHRGECEAVM